MFGTQPRPSTHQDRNILSEGVLCDLPIANARGEQKIAFVESKALASRTDAVRTMFLHVIARRSAYPQCFRCCELQTPDRTVFINAVCWKVIVGHSR